MITRPVFLRATRRFVARRGGPQAVRIRSRGEAATELWREMMRRTIGKP
jgi:hypothetical protein